MHVLAGKRSWVAQIKDMALSRRCGRLRAGLYRVEVRGHCLLPLPAQLLTAADTFASNTSGVGYKIGEPVAIEISARAEVGPSDVNFTM